MAGARWSELWARFQGFLHYGAKYYGTYLGTFSSRSALLGAVFRFFSHGAFKRNKYILPSVPTYMKVSIYRESPRVDFTPFLCLYIVFPRWKTKGTKHNITSTYSIKVIITDYPSKLVTV